MKQQIRISQIEIVVSSGNEAPASDTEDTSATDNTASAQSTDSTQQSAAAANGEVWKCTQTLNTPTGYQGGQVRLELLQDVNGEHSLRSLWTANR